MIGAVLDCEETWVQWKTIGRSKHSCFSYTTVSPTSTKTANLVAAIGKDRRF